MAKKKNHVSYPGDPAKISPALSALVEPVDILLPDPANARKHPQKNLDALMGSLQRFGQQKPIVADQDGIVRAGNGTLLAARALGWQRIAVVRTRLSGSEATAFAIADNRTAELADWDTEVLAAALHLEEIGDVGFDDAEIAKLLAEPNTVGAAKAAADEEPGWDVCSLVVECPDEASRTALEERLRGEGLTVRRIDRGREV